MYANVCGNVVCVCTLTSMPVYREEAGEKRLELTSVAAKAIEASPEGTQTVFITVLFYTVMAIPAKALKAGDVIVVFGREASKEKFLRGRYKLNRTVIADFWMPRWIDPFGTIMNLQIRRDVALKEREYKELMAEHLTAARPAIVRMVLDALLAMKNGDNSNAEKKDGE